MSDRLSVGASWSRTAVVIVVFAIVGALAGIAWQASWEAPVGVAFEGEWYLDPAGPDVALSGTVTYVLIALAVGAVLGVLAALASRDEIATLVGVVVGSVLAGWLMYAVGHALGPPDPRQLAAGQADFTPIPGDLVLVAPDDSRNPWRSTALCAFPVGALTGLAVVFLLGRRRAG